MNKKKYEGKSKYDSIHERLKRLLLGSIFSILYFPYTKTILWYWPGLYLNLWFIIVYYHVPIINFIISKLNTGFGTNIQNIIPYVLQYNYFVSIVASIFVFFVYFTFNTGNTKNGESKNLYKAICNNIYSIAGVLYTKKKTDTLFVFIKAFPDIFKHVMRGDFDAAESNIPEEYKPGFGNKKNNHIQEKMKLDSNNILGSYISILTHEIENRAANDNQSITGFQQKILANQISILSSNVTAIKGYVTSSLERTSVQILRLSVLTFFMVLPFALIDLFNVLVSLFFYNITLMLFLAPILMQPFISNPFDDPEKNLFLSTDTRVAIFAKQAMDNIEFLETKSY